MSGISIKGKSLRKSVILASLVSGTLHGNWEVSVKVNILGAAFLLTLLLMCRLPAYAGDNVDIFKAVEGGNIEEVKKILDLEPSALSGRRNMGLVPGYTPLHVAASRGDYKMVQFILGRGISPDVQAQDGSTPLHMAILNQLDDNVAETVIALLKYGADINAQNIYRQTPLDIVLERGSGAMIDFLTMLGAKRGKLDQTLDTPRVDP